LAAVGLSSLPDDIVVYEISGPIFFGATERFERSLLETHTTPRVLVLRLGRVPFMDITGLQALEEVIEELRRRGVIVLLCEANGRVLGKLRVAGIITADEDGYSSTLHDALLHALRLVQLP
jgi:SulP family sulfate permease